MSRLFFYSILAIFDFIAFIFLLNRFVPKTGFGGYFEGIIIEICLSLVTILIIIVYEVLRVKGIIKKNLNIENKKNRYITITIILIIIAMEAIIFLSN